MYKNNLQQTKYFKSNKRRKIIQDKKKSLGTKPDSPENLKEK